MFLLDIQAPDPVQAPPGKKAPWQLDDQAVAWMAKLPRKVQPRALAHKYARIANKLALLSSTGDALEQYLNELLTDQRGNREGFPEEVITELRLLADYSKTK